MGPPQPPTTVPSAAPQRQRRKGEATAERILNAAEALFAERGYAGTTLRDVATAVDLRIPSLYNHFPSKEALYEAVLERGIQPVLVVLSELVDGDSAQRAASRVVERIMALLARRPALPRLIQHEALSGGEHLTPMLREWIGPVFARANELIRVNPAAKRWAPEEIPLLTLALYHAVVGYFTLAPFYKGMSGIDLLSDQALATQTRFISELVNTLLPESTRT